MENFFWFLRRPRSKREALVYEKAYRRSFTVVAAILLFSLVVTAILGVSVILYDLPLMTPELSSSSVLLFLQTFVVLIFGAGIFSGWTVARHHKLSDGMKPIQLPYPTVRRVVVWLLVAVPSIAFAVIVAVPGLFADIIVGLYLLLHVSLSLLAWRYAVTLPVISRFWMSIAVPVFTMYYTQFAEERDVRKRISHALARTIASRVAYGFAVCAFLILSGRLFVFKPILTYGASSDTRGGEGDYALMRVCGDCYGALQENELILFRDSRNPRQTSVSRVVRVEQRGVIVETNGGQRLVPWELVVAKGPVPTYHFTKAIGRHFTHNYAR